MEINATQKISTGIKLSAFSMALALAGCGGGSPIDVVQGKIPNGGSGSSSGNTGGSTGGTTTTSAVNISSMKLYDTSNKEVSVLGINGGQVKIKVTNASGSPLPNAQVTFAISATGVTLNQSTSGSVLTDSEGNAQIRATPNSVNTRGAYTVTATVAHEGKTTKKDLSFSVQATEIQLSDITLDKTAIDSAAQTGFNLKVTDKNNKAVSNVTVSFSASCGQITKQQSSDPEGKIEGVYKSTNADGTLCEGPVTLSATTSSVTSKPATVTVAAAEATSIAYVTEGEVSMGIKGSGSNSDSKSIQFQVKSNGAVLKSTEVTVSLNKSPAGFSFVTDGNKAKQTLKTDEKGKVTVNLYAGETAGPVEIEASVQVGSTTKSALAKNVFVAGARTTQERFGLALSKNVVSWSADGNEIKFTARLADRNGNAVPDGTVVNFTTEGGAIKPSACTTTNGVCETTFTTQNRRPADGRVSVLAYTEGEKLYIDKNGNNAWDKGTDDLAANIGSTYRDDNENNQYDANLGEFVYRINNEGTETCAGIGQYIYPNIANTCNNDLNAILRKQVITLLSSDSINITLLGGQQFRLNSTAYPKNPPPAGAVVTITTDDRTKNNELSCSAKIISGVTPIPAIQPVGRPGDELGAVFGYSFKECESPDMIEVTVTSGGRKSIRSFPYNAGAD